MATINFSGLASGIDFEALIKATSDASRATRVLPHQKKIQDITDNSNALGELKSKFATLQTKLKAFSTTSGGALAKQASSSDETLIKATASSAAPNGTYDITVATRAKSHTLSFNDRFAASDSILASTIAEPATNAGAHSRELGITVGTNPIFYVDITRTTKLSDVADSINSQNKGVIATVVNTGQTPPYALFLKSTSTGTTNGLITVSTGVDLAAVSLFQNDTEDPATNATINISGINGTITSQTNSISGVIPGVTLDLVDTTATAVTVTVADDVAGTSAKITEFVNAYNDIIKFMAEKNKIERQEEGARVTNVFGPLSISRIDENAITAMRTEFSNATYTSGVKVRMLADIGITTNRDGTLKFESSGSKTGTDLTTALSNESASVERILTRLADSAALTNGTIDQYIGFNRIIDTTLTNNKDRVSELNERIATAEALILRNETAMRSRFSRLESLSSQLQQQGAQLSSALSGLQK